MPACHDLSLGPLLEHIYWMDYDSHRTTIFSSLCLVYNTVSLQACPVLLVVQFTKYLIMLSKVGGRDFLFVMSVVVYAIKTFVFGKACQALAFFECTLGGFVWRSKKR